MSRIDDPLADVTAGVAHKALGELGQFIRGHGLQKSDLTNKGAPAIHYGEIHTYYNTWATMTKSFIDPVLAARLRQAKGSSTI